MLRRRWLSHACRCGAAAVLNSSPALAIGERAATRANPRFVSLAFEMRRRAIERGDQPYGAVVVRGDEVLGEGVSAVLTSGDPQAHAEIVAMRAASVRLGRDDLRGCELYGSSRACNRCESFAHRMKIARMVYGERGEDAGAPGGAGLLLAAEAPVVLAQFPVPSMADHALFTSAERGDVAGIRAALAQGARIDGMDPQGRQAIMLATRAGKVAAVKVLIEAGADVNLRDSLSDNPLLYSGASGQLDILRLAIAARADTRLTNRYGGTALTPAAHYGHVEVVRELLTRTDVAVDHVNNLGWTALLEAILLSDGGPKHQAIVRLLIDHKANVHLPDKNGISPLRHARQRGFREIVTMLEQAGAR